MQDKSPSALIPSPEVILQLKEAGMSSETLGLLIMDDRRGKKQYAITMGVMGGICFLGAMGGFVYLVMEGHSTAAGVLLGVEVLAIIKQMLGIRLV